MTTTTLTLGRPGLFHGRSAFDWLYAAVVLLGSAYAFSRYGASMDVYERGILAAATPALIGLGWFWGPLRVLALAVGASALFAIHLYGRATDGYGVDLAAGEKVFWLKYFLASQTAFLWMGLLFLLSTLFYWIGLFVSAAQGRPKPTSAPRGQEPQATMGLGSSAKGLQDNSAQRIGSGMAWAAVYFALTGTMVRWFESHQIGPDIGHIPVSNLFEVFVLFCWLTTTFYLYFEQHYKTRALGAFVMLVVSAGVGFLSWYSFVRGASEIEPLVPALQSWWMKLHVPANFIGYGSFSLSAMVSMAYLLKTASPRNLWTGLVGVPVVVGILPMLAFLGAGHLGADNAAAVQKALQMVGGVALFCAAAIVLRVPINRATPAPVLMDDLMYKAIAVGFAFFTIATILGAFWAAEAWGGYWSWDPKETWALIVWLNYAAWLHMRLMKGLRGSAAAWWSLTGLVVTSFAFLGVNMFLSGLHSYGKL
jgi:cytochrome c-type biogenesis protein CcsB